ncbi:MAG: CIA30 family protein, partial [Myxococcota bacterium]
LAPPFRTTFPTDAGEWKEITIPFAGLRPWNFRGPIEGPEAPGFDPRAVRAVGFMIYDGRDGPFSLEVDWVRPVPP